MVLVMIFVNLPDHRSRYASTLNFLGLAFSVPSSWLGWLGFNLARFRAIPNFIGSESGCVRESSTIVG